MPRRLPRLAAVSVLAVALFAAAAGQARACPFCLEELGPTLVGDFDEADLVLVGTFTNPRAGKDGGTLDGVTDFVIEEVLKPHPSAEGKKVITLPKFISTKNKFVVYCDVYKGVTDPYRGIELSPDSDLVKYIRGGIAVKNRPIGERLRYCFDFLSSPEFEVGRDAYREFGKADYEDYRKMAETLPAEKLAGWLRDPKTSPYRHGLYGSLLGHCGNLEHAKLIKGIIEDPQKRRSSGIDGLLAGYLILMHKEGKGKEALDYLRGMLTDRKQEFMVRYAALKATRFFWNYRPDVFAKSDLVENLSMALEHKDMADFAIEDLAKWQRWEMTDRVLGLWDRDSHDVPVIKRSILRFMLRNPTAPAVAFVRAQRARDPEFVTDTEELLRLETPAAPADGKNGK